MKIIEAINKTDSLKPNSYSQKEKIGWLSALDGIITENIIKKHDDAKTVNFKGYTDEETETELLVLAPYDNIYIYWLQSQIDYYNQEIANYNNSIAMYNAAYSEYERYYNRTHLPNSNNFKFF